MNPHKHPVGQTFRFATLCRYYIGQGFSLAFLFNNFKKKSCINLWLKRKDKPQDSTRLAQIKNSKNKSCVNPCNPWLKNKSCINLWLLFAILFSLSCSRAKYIEKAEEIGLSEELTVFVISTLPIVELRGALPVGINYLKLRWEKTLVISLLGNLLPVMPLLLLWGFLYKVLGKIPIFKKILDYIFSKTKSRSEIVRRYEIIGLIAFVAIPLPGTGAWTGSIAAFLLGLDKLKSFIAISIGVLIAGVVVTSLCLLGIWGAIIALVALIILGSTGVFKLWK